jgi:ketosteroid isomerase-like protein
MTTEEVIEEFTRRWNEGDLDSYLELFADDVVVYADETWPENDTVRGREGIAKFWQDFRGVWEDVKLRVNTLHVGDDVAAADCEWVTRGRASGVEGTIEFAFTTWIEGDLVKRGQFFETFPDALRAAGLDP